MALNQGSLIGVDTKYFNINRIICQKIIFRQAWVNLVPTSSTVPPWYAVFTSLLLPVVGWRSRCGDGDRTAVGSFLFDQCAQHGDIVLLVGMRLE